MEQYNMRANFYPVKEPINGFIGSADLAISNIIRLRGIAVFEDKDGKGGHHIQFPGFGEGDAFKSYVIPHSPEAHAQILDVVEKAIAAEDHFGHVAGKRKAFLTVEGRAVDEPHADGRYALQVADILTVHGITTNEIPLNRDGKESTFIAVNVPNLPPYEKDGEKVYPPIFKGLKSTWEKDGKPASMDYAQFIRHLVIAERQKVLGKEPLDQQVGNAEKKAKEGVSGKDAPAKEVQR